MGIRLFYKDARLERPEVEEALKLVWEEIQLIEYDYIYEGFRGVHLSDDETKIYVTFQIGSGGFDNAGMAVVDRATKIVDFAIPPTELLQKEMESLESMLGKSGEDLSAKDLAMRLREVEDLLY